MRFTVESAKLLYLFLTMKYKNIEIVFIRHTEKAKEVDENTFFNSKETGGTVVSSAFEEMLRVQKARYPSNEWHIYVAQAGDGDNTAVDNAKCETLLRKIFGMIEYFAYIETPTSPISSDSILWKAYAALKKTLGMSAPRESFAMRKVTKREDIFPVLESLFSKHAKNENNPAGAPSVAAWERSSFPKPAP